MSVKVYTVPQRFSVPCVLRIIRQAPAILFIFYVREPYLSQFYRMFLFLLPYTPYTPAYTRIHTRIHTRTHRPALPSRYITVSAVRHAAVHIHGVRAVLPDSVKEYFLSGKLSK